MRKGRERMVNWAISFLLALLVMSGVILIIMLYNKLFPKVFSPKLRYAIWLVILIGLIIPFRPVIGGGIFTIRAPETTQIQSESAEALSAENDTKDTEPAQNNADTELDESIPSNSAVSAVTVCIWIWSIVSILMLAWHIWHYVRFVRMIRRWGVPVEEGQMLSIFKSVQNELGLENKKVDLKICNFVSSSMLTGFLRPVVLLPDRHFDEDELQLIFKHELIHFKRHDLFVKLLIVIAACCHWFNPIVYWMCAAMQLDGEASCDEDVLQNTNIEGRLFYGEVIIGMIGNSKAPKTALSTCFYAGKSNMKRRLDSIMDAKQKKRKIAMISVILVATVTLFSGSVVALTNPTEAAQETEITAQQAEEIAIATVGGGTVIENKVDYENGRKVYEIDIIYGDNIYDMDVDALNSKVTNYKAEAIQSSSKSSSNPDGTQSSPELLPQ